MSMQWAMVPVGTLDPKTLTKNAGREIGALGTAADLSTTP